QYGVSRKTIYRWLSRYRGQRLRHSAQLDKVLQLAVAEVGASGLHVSMKASIFDGLERSGRHVLPAIVPHDRVAGVEVHGRGDDPRHLLEPVGERSRALLAVHPGHLEV